MHALPRLLPDRRQLARQAGALRLVLHHEAAVSCPPAVMGESEEGEGFRSLVTTSLSSRGRETPELDQPRFLLVKLQAEPSQPLLEVMHHPLRVGHLLDAHHEVVGVAHDRYLTARMPPAPLMNPKIEDVVQEDVGQQRTDPRTLRRTPV